MKNSLESGFARFFRAGFCWFSLGQPRISSLPTFVLLLVVLNLGNLGLDADLLVAQQQEAQDVPSAPTLRTFDPVPQLVVAKTKRTQAKFPVIDIHSHFGYRFKGDRDQLENYLKAMDSNRIGVSSSLDAKLGAEEVHLEFIGAGQGKRLAAFVHIDFKGAGSLDDAKTLACNQIRFVRQCVEQLRLAKKNGILGVKFFNSFGLRDLNRDGSLVKIDDKRFDPIWKTCGELGLPIIMHTSDPAAFFKPIDANNERWEELSRHPDWSFYGDKFPARQELLEARNRVIKRHPKTTFIGAHFASSSEDLATLSKWMDEYPNLVVEFASRINELGRQPYTARKFFIKYQDRILFGTDGPWPELRLSYYWRFLETYDENFPYSEKSPAPQGMWRIYGIGLPDEVLKKIYHENALRIIPGIEEAFLKATSEQKNNK